MHDQVSIIVPTFNNLDCIQRVTNDVLQFTEDPYELIIVDNASDLEPVARYLEEARQREHVRIVRMPKNGLYWSAVNAGIRASQPESDFYLALNDDVLVQGRGWIGRLVGLIASRPRIGIVGDFQRNGLPPLDGWVDGWCALIRRELVEDIGLIDDGRYPFYYGFVDFQYRAYRRGYVVQDMKAEGDINDRVQGIAIHLRGATLKPLLEKGYFPAEMRHTMFPTGMQPLRILLRHGMIGTALNMILTLLGRSAVRTYHRIARHLR